MNAQPITPIAPSVPAVRHGRMRSAALAAGVAAIVAAGGYAVIQAVVPDTAERSAVTGAAAPAVERQRALDDLRDSLANQYRTAAVPAPSPSAARLQEIRDSLANQYRTIPAATASPSAAHLRQIRDSLANQYRTIPAAAATPSTGQLREIREGLAAQYGGNR